MKNKKAFLIIIGFLVFFNVFVWLEVYNLRPGHNLRVIFFDVGQGDAIFVETPDHHQILIDGGPSSAVLEKLAKEMPFYDRTVDLIILSHPEKDHITGLLDVLKKYRVENILWTGVVRDTPEWQEWERLIKEEKAKIVLAESGQKVVLQNTPPAFIEVLYPLENLSGQIFENSNNTSIVCKLVFLNNSFLFTGDAEKQTENKIISEDIGSNVLKVAHHGSKTSTSESFLEKVSPDVAVIQVGDNNYGHPHSEILQRLQNFGIKVLTTKDNGDIRIISDGKSIKTIKIKN